MAWFSSKASDIVIKMNDVSLKVYNLMQQCGEEYIDVQSNWMQALHMWEISNVACAPIFCKHGAQQDLIPGLFSDSGIVVILNGKK